MSVCVWQRVVCPLSLRSPFPSHSLSIRIACPLSLTHSLLLIHSFIHSRARSLTLSIVCLVIKMLFVCFFNTLYISIYVYRRRRRRRCRRILCCVSLAIAQEYIHICAHILCYIIMVVYIYSTNARSLDEWIVELVCIFWLQTDWQKRRKSLESFVSNNSFLDGPMISDGWFSLSLAASFFRSSSFSAIVYYLLFAGFLIYSFTLHVSHYYFLSITFVFYFHCFSAAASSSRSCSCSCSCSLVVFGSLCACKLLARSMLLSFSCSRFYVKNQTLTHTTKRGRKRTKTRNYEQFWQNIQFFLSFSLSFTASRLNREEYSVRFYFGEMILLFRKYPIETVRNVHSPGWKKVSFWIWL